MLVALKVSNIKDSIDFFTTQMGMSVQPFPLARKAGSNFEEQQVKDSVYLSYTPDSLGILLLPPAKKALSPPSAGSQLNAFTFIVDDSSSRSEESVLPPLARAFLENEGPSQVYSPDGIPIRFRKYSGFEKEATKSIEF